MKRKNNNRFPARVFFIVYAALLLPPALAAQEAAKLVPALGWDRDKQGGFVTCAATDLQNNVWAGTEGRGLWRYDSRKKEWAHFMVNDNTGDDPAQGGLGDEYIYALAVDKLGRVWAGHLNHGVSVWNGAKWQNYGLLDGPLGDRVFSIATCPTDGDVWIATDCGVARYSLAKDDWDYYTRAGGLPSNQVQAIAFDSKGNIYLGTQCDGVVFASASDNYKKWTVVAGPKMPTTGTGDGLPSSIINDITVAQGDRIIVSTPEGMGESDDAAKTWKFVRGQDWKPNVDGLYPQAAEDNDPGAPPEQGVDGFFMEDWITCIRQDPKTKNIWSGYRKRGMEVRNEAMDKFIRGAQQSDWAYTIRGFCFPQKGPSLIAVADAHLGGLMMLDGDTAELQPGDEAPKTAPALPSPAKPVDADTLAALAKHLDAFKNKLNPGNGAFLGDDWRTEGDWAGHYGNCFAMLCGAGADAIFQPEQGFDVKIAIGPHNKEDTGETAPEVYVKSKHSIALRTPYDPVLGHRIEAELNDLSCRLPTYDADWEGPDLWVDTTVPAGLYQVSLYFDNNDEQSNTGGRDFDNKYRDYDLQLLSWQDDRDAVQRSQPQARARVVDFRGGVYKKFVVMGPARYVFRVGRNHSYGTKIQGVFIDRLAGDAPAKRTPLPGFEDVTYADVPVDDSAASPLWEAFDKAYDKPGVAGLQIPFRIMAYRAAVAAKAPDNLLATWRWQMGIWTKEDRDAFDKAMADAFKVYIVKHPAAAEDTSDDEN